MIRETAVWEVEILSGASDIDMTSAPVRFGTPFIKATDDGEGEQGVPLVYGPVELFSINDALVIRTTQVTETLISAGTDEIWQQQAGNPVDHRELFRPQWEADEWGSLRVSGFEERSDGAQVRALWVVTPYYDSDEGEVMS